LLKPHLRIVRYRPAMILDSQHEFRNHLALRFGGDKEHLVRINRGAYMAQIVRAKACSATSSSGAQRGWQFRCVYFYGIWFGVDFTGHSWGLLGHLKLVSWASGGEL
jgi:hypothetical protein